jgi:propanediol dehydratase small subunit
MAAMEFVELAPMLEDFIMQRYSSVRPTRATQRLLRDKRAGASIFR